MPPDSSEPFAAASLGRTIKKASYTEGVDASNNTFQYSLSGNPSTVSSLTAGGFASYPFG